MARKLRFGGGVIVVPLSLMQGVEREVDASDATILIVYPNDTTGSDLDDILDKAARLAGAEPSEAETEA